VVVINRHLVAILLQPSYIYVVYCLLRYFIILVLGNCYIYICYIVLVLGRYTKLFFFLNFTDIDSLTQVTSERVL
jgi:hypothetical protein